MVGFDKTITIYNKKYDKKKKIDVWNRNVINGVSWYGKNAVRTDRGLSHMDHYSIRVLKKSMFDYINPTDYQELEDVEGFWTAQSGDIVVLGEGIEEFTLINEVTRKYTECFTITSVNHASLMLPLPHLRIEGV